MLIRDISMFKFCKYFIVRHLLLLLLQQDACKAERAVSIEVKFQVIELSVFSPAKLADMKQTMLPTINARKATDVIIPRRFGAIALKEPMRMPRELGLAKPQMAKVAMPALRACASILIREHS